MNIQSIRNSIVRNSPKLCAVVATVGVALTAYLAAKATPKAMSLIELKKEVLNKEILSKKEKVNAAWKCYIPSAASGVLTVAAIITGHSIHMQRYGELAVAYGLSQTAVRLYSEHVAKRLGEEDERKIRQDVGVQMMQTMTPPDTKVVPKLMTNEIGPRDQVNICYDYLSGRYFHASQNQIKEAIADYNENALKKNGQACLNDLYLCFHNPEELPEMGFANLLGWRYEEGREVVPLISVEPDANGNPCMVLDYVNPPQYDYDKR